jgi:hypothetical protein
MLVMADCEIELSVESCCLYSFLFAVNMSKILDVAKQFGGQFPSVNYMKRISMD